MAETAVLLEQEIAGWFAGRVPDGWFTEPPEATIDREEILVVGRIPEPEFPKGTPAAAKAAARSARIQRFREESRDRRIGIAIEAEHLWRRKVSWGAVCGDRRELFTTLSVPIMTRLRQAERMVLDTLEDAGVARSRSDALGWCVRVVGTKQEEWLAELRQAFRDVERVRARGPQLEEE